MGLQVDGDLLAGCSDLVTGRNVLIELVDSLGSGQGPLVGRLGQGRVAMLEKLEGVLAIEGQG